MLTALFQPNAPGRGELRSLRALRSRQLIKGRTQYLGERIRLEVTDREVSAHRLGPFGRTARLVGSWSPANLLAIEVPAVGVDAPGWPALVLLDLHRLQFVADLRAVRDGIREREVVRRLVAPPSVPVGGRR